MFYELRRKDRVLSNEEAILILEKAEFGVLSTISLSGYPYGVPVNFAFKNNAIFFHCAKDVGHKLENIKNNNRVCFTIVGNTELQPDKFSTKYESVILFGRAAEINGDEKSAALLLLLEKYSSEYNEIGKHYLEKDINITSVIKIDVEKITGKAKK